jgi:hypothetical protein
MEIKISIGFKWLMKRGRCEGFTAFAIATQGKIVYTSTHKKVFLFIVCW